MRVVEVGPRDGFQNLDVFVPTDAKVAIVDRLLPLGFDRVEVTSFVHPDAVPQMRDADAVVERLAPGGARRMALVPNRRGVERALDHGLDMLNFVISASETHNRANLNASVAESSAELERAVALSHGADTPMRLTIATSFGCPYEGFVDPDRVLDLARRGAELGVAEICLGDTTGMANPLSVFRLFTRLHDALPGLDTAVHLHNTRGSGSANLLAAMQAGVGVFDGSVGGMGGCPFAPGATGNVCTEDMVNMLQEMDVETGVDLDGLIAAARYVGEVLDVDLPGQVIKAGATCLWQPALREHGGSAPRPRS